jgi:fusion and transport protein UGO1
VPTVLHSLVAPIFTHATPLILRSRFAIDPVLTPSSYSLASFLSCTVELFVKLPLETVLRRGQLAVLASPNYTVQGKQLETIVDVGPYRGVVGTMWSVVREEGGSSVQATTKSTGGAASRKAKKAESKGQGVEGLWRGWRVGMWGLVGMWGAAAMGGAGGSGGEF